MLAQLKMRPRRQLQLTRMLRVTQAGRAAPPPRPEYHAPHPQNPRPAAPGPRHGNLNFEMAPGSLPAKSESLFPASGHWYWLAFESPGNLRVSGSGTRNQPPLNQGPRGLGQGHGHTPSPSASRRRGARPQRPAGGARAGRPHAASGWPAAAAAAAAAARAGPGGGPDIRACDRSKQTAQAILVYSRSRGARWVPE
jgi:hypothetical protein